MPLFFRLPISSGLLRYPKRIDTKGMSRKPHSAHPLGLLPVRHFVFVAAADASAPAAHKCRARIQSNATNPKRPEKPTDHPAGFILDLSPGSTAVHCEPVRRRRGRAIKPDQNRSSALPKYEAMHCTVTVPEAITGRIVECRAADLRRETHVPTLQRPKIKANPTGIWVRMFAFRRI